MRYFLNYHCGIEFIKQGMRALLFDVPHERREKQKNKCNSGLSLHVNLSKSDPSKISHHDLYCTGSGM